MLTDVREVRRLRSPAPEPQSLAFDGKALWMGSRATRRLFAIDPLTSTAHDEAGAPGIPWGLTYTGADFRVLCGEDPGDMRRIRRFSPQRGFASDAVDAPDDTGSYLAFGDGRLYLSQWYRRRILAVDDAGAVRKIIEVPHGICGLCIAGPSMFCLTTDDEETNDYWLTRVDERDGATETVDLARVPFHARSLAFDGTNFWTNHREKDEIVAFAPPPGAFGA